jgi:hypothetical protein
MMFGRIFGLRSIVSSGILGRPSTTIEDFKQIFEDLLEIAQTKSYLSEVCYHVLISMLPMVSTSVWSVIDLVYKQKSVLTKIFRSTMCNSRTKFWKFLFPLSSLIVSTHLINCNWSWLSRNLRQISIFRNSFPRGRAKTSWMSKTFPRLPACLKKFQLRTKKSKVIGALNCIRSGIPFLLP